MKFVVGWKIENRIVVIEIEFVLIFGTYANISFYLICYLPSYGKNNFFLNFV